MGPTIEAVEWKSAGAAASQELLHADGYALCVGTKDARRKVHGSSITRPHKLFAGQFETGDGIVYE